jgi:hypothetical protein
LTPYAQETRMQIRYTAITTAVLATGCAAATPGPAVTVTAPAPTTSSTPATPKAKAKAAPNKAIGAAKKVRVPNMVGKNHQLAQDTMQAAGFYLLAERDATGQGRMLIWDRNWVVVRQSPKGGSLADPNTATVTLFSKKIGE